MSRNAIVTRELTRTFKTHILTGYYSTSTDYGGTFFYEIWKRFRARKRTIYALYKLNLKVREGSFTCLLGPNGSGKTTLLRILATFLLPTSGTAEIMGYDVVNEKKEVLEHINYIPSFIAGSVWANPRLTVKKNLELMAKLMNYERESIERALRVTGLKELEHMPVGTLSTGQLARLILALGIMREAPVFLLDEPTMGLSPEAVRMVQDYLIDLCKKRRVTMLYSTHHLYEAERMADYVILLDKGRKIAEGTPEELIKSLGKVDVIEIKVNNVYFDLKKKLNIEAKFMKMETINSEIGRYKLKIGTPNSDEVLPDLVTRLTSLGAKIERIEVSRPTLEDVFIHLTQGKAYA